ncbi:MAG TPA: SUF system NifU family Fe-S cluster assembly protein [candidate division Zixibacteria bacterium]|nr:SUF system NifU family Fe-S cluster assembly protein [candidate division Zixibacteria bacterium]
MTNLDDMYREVILDHFRSPRGKKPITQPDVASHGHNPACGDELSLALEMADDTVKRVHVDCKGCAISTASGSILAEVIKGRSLEEAKRIAGIVRKMLKGEETEIPDDLGDVEALRGVCNFPVRVKCALLAWVTLIEGLRQYEQGRPADPPSVSTEESE